MKDLTGTKTLENLKTAFAGESMARNKYTYYASQAKKDGYVQIQHIFEETAANEKEHAKLWFKLFQGIGDTNCGSSCSRASAIPMRICSTRLPVRMKNGQSCTKRWLRLPERKGLMRSLRSWKALPRSSANTKRDISNSLRTSRTKPFSRRMMS